MGGQILRFLWKKIIALFAVSSLCASAFADKSRFFEDGKVIDTMFVDSPEGLRVRDRPSLKSNRICGIPHRIPVKVVAIGREETIDGITAPWVEILIPRHEWRGGESEFGWIFGGYLKETRPKFDRPKNREEFDRFLKSSYWHFHWDNSDWGTSRLGHFDGGRIIFFPDGSFSGTSLDCNPTFVVTGKNRFDSDGYYDDGYNGEDLYFICAGSTEVNIASEDFVIISSSQYGHAPYVNSPCKVVDNIWISKRFPLKMTGGRGDELDFSRLYEPIDGKSILQEIDGDEGGQIPARFVEKCIKYGISAKGTRFERQYRDLWDPIMAERQKKADEMK